MFDYTQVPSLIGQWSSHCGFLVNIYIFLDLYRDFLNFPRIFYHRKRNWRLRMNTFKEYRHRIVLHTLNFLKFFSSIFLERKRTRDAYEQSFLSNLFKHLSTPMNGHRVFNFLSDFSKERDQSLWTITFIVFRIFQNFSLRYF